jgi:hypothetical protein
MNARSEGRWDHSSCQDLCVAPWLAGSLFRWGSARALAAIAIHIEAELARRGLLCARLDVTHYEDGAEHVRQIIDSPLQKSSKRLRARGLGPERSSETDEIAHRGTRSLNRRYQD